MCEHVGEWGDIDVMACRAAPDDRIFFINPKLLDPNIIHDFVGEELDDDSPIPERSGD